MYTLLIIATLVVGAYFWRLGGNGYDLYRNPGVPILLALSKIGLFWVDAGSWSWLYLLALLYIPALWGMIQAVSYGITAPPHKMWVWIIGHLNGKYNDLTWRGMANNGQIAGVEIATRCTCGFCWSLASIVFAFLSMNWIMFGVYVLFLTIVNGLIWLLIQDVEINERTVGACVSTAILV